MTELAALQMELCEQPQAVAERTERITFLNPIKSWSGWAEMEFYNFRDRNRNLGSFLIVLFWLNFYVQETLAIFVPRKSPKIF